MKFVSPSSGPMDLKKVFNAIAQYIKENPEDEYRLMIGTDSRVRQHTVFVTAIIIHRVGKGGKYFYCKQRHRPMDSLRQRMYFETSLSLEVAARLTAMLAEAELDDLRLEIHLDIGPCGETKSLIRELVGMVMGSGFAARIKPHSIGASKVADKHTRG
ncbi:MAG: hypothetical protein GX090_06730 [Firmicutes bacterium]|nr:hypothetical protein [Bacillota bacterium]HOB35382.1 ribonuclease H-like YkuK family protein [Bacillota bacterium]HPZ91302.1 ribonuclease H-like YkuK family protein [Bacillota bacterium]HQE02447.1 ribonuclease H-like YkuK family protein [Bacillota bacterium]